APCSGDFRLFDFSSRCLVSPTWVCSDRSVGHPPADPSRHLPAHRSSPSNLRRSLGITSGTMSHDFEGYNFIVSSSRVKQVASADFPTRWGHFLIHGFTTRASTAGEGERNEEAVALVMGEVHSGSPLVRIHSQCLTGDVFGSLRCDCRQQLEMALSMIAE